jgi:DNA repair exonuclease SbcCD ATPase subunit
LYNELQLSNEQRQQLAEQWHRWRSRSAALFRELADALDTLDQNLSNLCNISAVLQISVDAACQLGCVLLT